MSLCKALYITSENEKLLSGRALFRMFRVIFLHTQQRARGCQRQQNQLDAFRRLPDEYPDGQDWANNGNQYHPITTDVVRHLTNPLKPQDVDTDPFWTTNSVILVTGSADRAMLNTLMAKVLAARETKLLYRWKRPLVQVPDALENIQDLIYDEDERPMLFGYFFKGAKGQVLDNANGNVGYGVANGTACIYYSIAWDDESRTREVERLTQAAVREGRSCVDLPFPPEFINAILLDRDNTSVTSAAWPDELNLRQAYDGDVVVLPFGVTASTSEKFTVTIDAIPPNKAIKITYEQHAVELAMALTIWKAQGGTFDRAILHLEGSKGSPSWGFEHLYVALSRIRHADSLRCIPLSILYNREKLARLRPNIFVTKWRMDIGHAGYWQPRTRHKTVH